MAFIPDSFVPPRVHETHRLYLQVLSGDCEFFAREAFAYSIFEKSAALRYVGCLYIKPIKSRLENDRRKALFQAQAFCWFSPAAIDHEFVNLAADEIVQWVETSWPFTAVAFPGRTICWDEWNSLAGQQGG